ncbi:hypothetical protein B0H13DRAFT_2028492 [Mycena leptocephala]|nr:hypothetical protein B0H13DRAFT_2028492 [Mycena leptocephala]
MSTGKDYAHAISTDAARVATSTTNRLSVFSVMSDFKLGWKPLFSSDGQILACTHEGRIQLFNAASGHAIKELNIRVDDHDIGHVAISPQNDYMLTDRVWYLSDGKLANVYSNNNLTVGGRMIESISVSPDTALLAVGICSTSFSSHGNLLISGSEDQTVRVWQCSPQTQTWSCIAVLYGHSCAVEFEVHPDKGGLVVDAWFRQGICLGGWRMGEPFVFQYPFELPEGVQPLEWRIQSEQEDGGNDTQVNELAD